LAKLTVGELQDFMKDMPRETVIDAWLPWLEDMSSDDPTPDAHRELAIDREFVSVESFTLVVQENTNG
jgi:hypothetical protein